MQNCNLLEKNLNYIGKFVGSVLICKLENGKTFAAKLESISPSGMLIFVNSRGRTFTDMIQDIVEISEYRKPIDANPAEKVC